jgi:hypothetical protein
MGRLLATGYLLFAGYPGSLFLFLALLAAHRFSEWRGA